jgi:D-alanyl-D-alanine carboxypeptidase/D-alanyl-D-alanine-endopeptidase (penicillin-binding protein 4)
VRTALASCALLALAAGASAAPPSDPLARGIDRILDRPAFAAAFWGIEVRGLTSGRLLYARNAEKSFRPASTLKLVTTAAALDLFGPDARLRTTVETTGRLDGRGRILGDVYLVGRGDPDLSGRFASDNELAVFEELAEALRAAGVRRIEGRVVGHEGAFTGDRRGSDWGWEDLTWSYGAEVSALSFNDNTVELKLLPGERALDPALLEMSPRSSYYSVASTAVTTSAGAKRDLTLVRDPGSNRIRITGALPIGETWEGRVALEDPARYAATVFAEVLEAKGIRVTGPVATSSDSLPLESRVLAAHESPTFSEMLKVVNKESQNLHAEMLLRLLGQRTRGEGSVAAGHEAVQAFLARLGVAADWGLEDGSGLSRSDLVSPRGLVALLAAMARHPEAAPFRESLAVMGVDGTLKSRLKGTPAEGRIQAKTGTLRLVNALAGYATRPAGEPLVFSIVVNNHNLPGREAVAAIDEISQLLVAR